MPVYRFESIDGSGLLPLDPLGAEPHSMPCSDLGADPVASLPSGFWVGAAGGDAGWRAEGRRAGRAVCTPPTCTQALGHSALYVPSRQLQQHHLSCPSSQEGEGAWPGPPLCTRSFSKLSLPSSPFGWVCGALTDPNRTPA